MYIAIRQQRCSQVFPWSVFLTRLLFNLVFSHFSLKKQIHALHKRLGTQNQQLVNLSSGQSAGGPGMLPPCDLNDSINLGAADLDQLVMGLMDWVEL